MKIYISHVLLILLNISIFSGCAQKINPSSINDAIIPIDTRDISTFLSSKKYSTYDEKQGKITIYYFKNKDGILKESSTTEYIPTDYPDQLYSPFSGVTLTLRILTNNKVKTLEAALENEVKKNYFVRLFKNKDEFLIGNNFAFEIQVAIREFNDRMQRQENDHSMFPFHHFFF